MLVLLLAACSDSIALGQGKTDDARLLVDAFTWYCSDSVDVYEGTWDFQISLAYSPDATHDLDTPESGACDEGLDLFPSDAGEGGHDIPDVTTPSWSNGTLGDTLPEVSTGWYYTNLSEDQQACTEPETLFADGVTLSDAGVFSGAATPDLGSTAPVQLDQEIVETGLTEGQEVSGTFDGSGWDKTWFQVRRETNGGDLLESVTCDTTGTDSFDVSADVWAKFNGAVAADRTNLYVGFEAQDLYTTEDGQRIQVISRMVHSVVVN